MSREYAYIALVEAVTELVKYGYVESNSLLIALIATIVIVVIGEIKNKGIYKANIKEIALSIVTIFLMSIGAYESGVKPIKQFYLT